MTNAGMERHKKKCAKQLANRTEMRNTRIRNLREGIADLRARVQKLDEKSQTCYKRTKMTQAISEMVLELQQMGVKIPE